MPTRRRKQFIHGQFAWMVATVFLLVLLESLSYELFFVLSLIGLLIMTELTTPVNVTPEWRRRIRWLIGIGLVGFAVIVTRRIVEILPPEVLPL
ncbi:hypothetical protein [Natrarchaeobius chitinivorans]|uniref:Uncharacterized protein n=1 Tax=Natrarchaeobius chitinivorans TaxID=1679083 RepID=A0A3N6PAA9_NATCH|nr:hypothetical protein [Natrarchaeobius chitinivorans]RQG96019.1 hypothetical protein EA473_07545 [Natrarchaeobius chitinivorans]